MFVRKWWPVGVCCVLFLFMACSGKAQIQSKSMEQLYKEKGSPVEVRTVQPQSFSVYMEYPAEFRARTQSTAYAKISDVVRTINVRVGQKVKRDDIVMTFSLDNSNYQQAKVSYDNAKSVYDRMKALFAASGVSKQDFDNTQTQYELARESFRSASELVCVKAPIDGYITQLNVQTSANVNPGDALFTVSNQDGYEAYFYVMPEEMSNISVGERALISDRDETIEGRITEASLNLDPVRKAFLVKAFFAGKPKTLVSGMNVDVSVEVYNKNNAYVMSQNELVQNGNDWAAYIVKDNTAEKKNVVFGHQQGIEYEIIHGLAKGDQLVTVGAQNLYDGEKVNIITAPLAKKDSDGDKNE